MIFKSRHELEMIHLTHKKDLTFSFFLHGGLFRVMCGEILINQVLGSPVEGSLNNIYLRIKKCDSIEFVPLVGPQSQSTFAYSDRKAIWKGQWKGIAYTCSLILHPEETLWFWTVDLHNLAATEQICDVIYVQDIGLAPEAVVRSNEAYCSQYIDHYVLTHPQYGFVVCSRQNQAHLGTYPWLSQGCTGRAVGYVTDAFSFYGLSYKDHPIPYALTQERLASEKKQYEMAFCGLQSEDLRVAPEERVSVAFYAIYMPHHPAPTQEADQARINAGLARVLQSQESETASVLTDQVVVKTAFQHAAMMPSHDLTEDDLHELFPAPRRHPEYVEGEWLSFFYGHATHVVLKAKEMHVERPHGHILRSGSSLLPHEDIMSSTAYIYGVFHSHMTVGNISFNKLLSLMRTPLNLFKSSGQRIFVKCGDIYRLLGMPSCYEIGLNACRWIYKTDQGRIIIKSWMSIHESVAFLSIESDYAHEFVVLNNLVLGSHELDHRGHIDIHAQTATAKLTPHEDTEIRKLYPNTVFYITTAETEKVKDIGTDEWLFADGQSRSLPYLTIQTKRVNTFSLVVTGSALQAEGAEALCRKYQMQSVDFEQDQQGAWDFWQNASKQPRLSWYREHQLIEKLNDIFYWYLHNGLIHCTTPYGLEQYTGAAWGVRDVCQGPVELFLATRNYTTIKDILLVVFSHQYEDTADWPQWFMLDRFAHIQHPDSHGDIIVWPLKALALYLEATNDFSILEVKVPYTEPNSFAFTRQESTLLQHMRRAIDTIEARFMPGTALSRYGAGDWNDTLQPADSAMRERMVSAWTVSLTYQVFQQLAHALQRAGVDRERQRVHHLAQRMKEDFQHHLMQDRVVSGFGYFHEDGRVEHIIHPSDERTGIQYRLLPMTRSMISELFSPEQARDHLRIIDEHLTFPDGVRLMNKPVPYQGGVRIFFRRAEEAAYFGREIGLQYVHAHIRYLEAMCKTGQVIKAYEAICQIMPINIQDHVPNAQMRQSNTYFSSSDATAKDRYEAEALFHRLREGKISVKGGWRIYSSGPGIFMNQIIANFLGLRDYYEYVVIDPVLPKSLHGLRFAFEAEGRSITYVFAIARDEGGAVQSVRVNGRDAVFVRQDNSYRLGGAMIERSAFHALLNGEDNTVLVSVD